MGKRNSGTSGPLWALGALFFAIGAVCIYAANGTSASTRDEAPAVRDGAGDSQPTITQFLIQPVAAVGAVLLLVVVIVGVVQVGLLDVLTEWVGTTLRGADGYTANLSPADVFGPALLTGFFVIGWGIAYRLVHWVSPSCPIVARVGGGLVLGAVVPGALLLGIYSSVPESSGSAVSLLNKVGLLPGQIVKTYTLLAFGSALTPAMEWYFSPDNGTRVRARIRRL